MDTEFTYRPLDHATWSDDGKHEYEACRFRAGYKDTLGLLRRELREMMPGEYRVQVERALKHLVSMGATLNNTNRR